MHTFVAIIIINRRFKIQNVFQHFNLCDGCRCSVYAQPLYSSFRLESALHLLRMYEMLCDTRPSVNGVLSACFTWPKFTLPKYLLIIRLINHVVLGLTFTHTIILLSTHLSAFAANISFCWENMLACVRAFEYRTLTSRQPIALYVVFRSPVSWSPRAFDGTHIAKDYLLEIKTPSRRMLLWTENCKMSGSTMCDTLSAKIAQKLWWWSFAAMASNRRRGRDLKLIFKKKKRSGNV